MYTVVKYTPDQIRKMEESVEIRKASEPIELIKLVRPHYRFWVLPVILVHCVIKEVILVFGCSCYFTSNEELFVVLKGKRNQEGIFK